MKTHAHVLFSLYTTDCNPRLGVVLFVVCRLCLKSVSAIVRP